MINQEREGYLRYKSSGRRSTKGFTAAEDLENSPQWLGYDIAAYDFDGA